MKRPFAVIGFSMLISSLLIIKLSFKMAVALVIGAIAIFCFLLPFKKLRKQKTVFFSIIAVVVYTISFMLVQTGYYDAREKMQNNKEVTGTICQTPAISDYSFTYIIKCDDEDYKMRLVTKDDKFLTEGDRVRVRYNATKDNLNEDFFEYSLSSKVYFTVFENEESTIEQIKGESWYYKNIGRIKNCFSSVVDEYLPTGAGAIAKAMTIGDRSRLSDKTVDYFNYSGTSHLLVISGLHITMWSLGILKILERFIKSKKVLVALTLFTLFGYSAITGFGVSVIRAGLLVGMVIVSKLFDRDADSLNSIGLALVVILVSNPFSVYSTSLWLTVLSTVGILVLSHPIIRLIEDFCNKKHIPVNGFTKFLINSVSISLSTSICTLPVFIVKLKMVSVGSIFANLIMVDLALLLMVLTVFGVALHLLSVHFFSGPIFMIVGLLAEFLTLVAEKIGMAEWSTISVSHRYFEYFLVALAFCVILAITLKKYNKNIVKHIAVILSVVFVLITCYTRVYDYNNPCVEIVFTEKKPVIVVKSGDAGFLVGTHKKQYLAHIKTMLNAHNKKSLDGIVVTEDENETISHLIATYDSFGVAQTYFCENAPKILESHSKGNEKEIIIGEKVKVDLHNPEEELIISSKNKNIIFINCDKENDFKNLEDYDIIILYGEKSFEYANMLKRIQPNLETKIVVSQFDEQEMTIYFE